MQFELATLLLIVVLVIVVSLVVQGIFLGIGLGFVDGRNRDLSTTFVTALLMSLVIWIPCLGCILAWYFIKIRHDVGWGGALAAWILGAIIQVIVLVVIFFAFFGGLGVLFSLIPFFP